MYTVGGEERKRGNLNTESRETAATAMDRRSFFAYATAAIAGLMGLVLSIPLVGYIVSPALKRLKRQDWSDAGSIEALEAMEPRELSYVITAQDGWLPTTVMRSVWAVRHPDGALVIYSPICPHLGCAYRWEKERQRFRCPCHDSIFDIEGRVLSGPAPRALDRLPAKVEDERLWVIYKEFKVGVPQQIEI
jgi:menaquinol-cytochrome c reductase iron-sulfur subunit